MAEEIINIATLTIDKSGVNESIVETRKQIFELQKSNSELRKDIIKNGDATGEQTKRFVDNEKALKDLQTSYRTQQAAINDLTLSELQNTAALKENAKSIGQAEAQNKILLETKKQLNLSTDEGVKAMELINAKMDENTRFIKANDNADQARQSNIGKYPTLVTVAGGAFGGFSDKVEQARTIVGGFGKTVNDVSDALTNGVNATIQQTRATLGFRTQTIIATEATAAQTVATEAQTVATEAGTVATAASVTGFKALKLAIIATGIGALAILLISVYTALGQNEAASNKFSKALSSFKGILNAVFAVLRPLGEFLIDKIVAGFEFAGAAAEKALGLIADGLEAIGFDGASKSVRGFTASVKSSIDATQRLDEAERQLAASQRYSQKIQLDYQKQAEKLRQARDDESKSIGQRIKANQALGAVLTKQTAEETKIANQAVANANLRIKLTGKSKDNLDALAEAQTKVSDIQERISGQESEQLQNLNSLRKESSDKARAATEANIKNKELELSAERAKNAQLNQTDEERLQFLGEITQKEINLLKEKKDKGLITEKEFQLGVLQNRKTLSEQVLSLAEKQIDQEIQAQNKQFEANTKLNEEALNESIANAQFLRDVQIKRINESTLLESEKAAAILEINKGYVAAIDILDQNAETARKEREAIRIQEEQTLRQSAFETRMLQLEEQHATEFEIRQAQLDFDHEQKQIALDAEFAAEKKTAEEIRALKELNDKQYAAATKKIDKDVAASKRKAQFEIVQNSLAAAQLIFGESKAIAVASALINTYQGITAELSTKAVTPYEIGLKVANIAFVAASGFAAVRNILKTDKGASGGGDTGGGTQAAPATFENAARVQTVATVNANPPQDQPQGAQPVLVVESLREVQNNVEVKIKSS